MGEAPPPHVPPFLPAFPDAHAYTATPLFPGHDTSARAAAEATAGAAAAGEAALVGLARRAAGGAAAGGPSVAAAVAAAIAAGGGARPDPAALATGQAALETGPFTEDALAAGRARAVRGAVQGSGGGGGGGPGEAAAAAAAAAGSAGRGKRGRGAATDAVSARAEALLEAGSDAMALDDE